MKVYTKIVLVYTKNTVLSHNLLCFSNSMSNLYDLLVFGNYIIPGHILLLHHEEGGTAFL